jgi:hypothetical protein
MECSQRVSAVACHYGTPDRPIGRQGPSCAKAAKPEVKTWLQQSRPCAPIVTDKASKWPTPASLLPDFGLSQGKNAVQIIVFIKIFKKYILKIKSECSFINCLSLPHF